MEMDFQNHPGNPTWSTPEISLQPDTTVLQLTALSKDQWIHWREKGYVVIHNVIADEQLDRTAEAIWDFEEKDPNDPATWYSPKNTKREMEMPELRGTGMVEMYNHQALWDNRQDENVYGIFCDIWQRADLWVSIDRANLNMPIVDDHKWEGFIHWDIDTSKKPLPQAVQGLLALTDQLDPKMGGFQCVPDLYADFENWESSQPADRDPFHPDISGFEVVKVPLKKGDLLVWNSLLPHGIRPNHSDTPRLVQYISMFPAEPYNDDLRQMRIESWSEKEIPQGYAFPGDPRLREKLHDPRARLTGLGKKLLGLDDWVQMS